MLTVPAAQVSRRLGLRRTEDRTLAGGACLVLDRPSPSSEPPPFGRKVLNSRRRGRGSAGSRRAAGTSRSGVFVRERDLTGVPTSIQSVADTLIGAHGLDGTELLECGGRADVERAADDLEQPVEHPLAAGLLNTFLPASRSTNCDLFIPLPRRRCAR